MRNIFIKTSITILLISVGAATAAVAAGFNETSWIEIFKNNLFTAELKKPVVEFSRQSQIAEQIRDGETHRLSDRENKLQSAAFNSFIVANLGDNGAGSLRQAILDANSAGGTNTITFSVSGEIILNSALPSLNGNLTIQGPGARFLTVRRSDAQGTPNFSVFRVGSSGVINISGLTIKNGLSLYGGGISSSGTLTISDCIVRDNLALRSGGGIANGTTISGATGTLTIRNCDISNNRALDEANQFGDGGGVFSGGTLIIENSTVSDNNAYFNGGGIYSFNTIQTTLNNVTVSGNSADEGGGLRILRGVSTLSNCTITTNTSRVQTGGGIRFSAANGEQDKLKLAQNIVAGNNGGDIEFYNPEINFPGITSLGSNLIGFGNAIGYFNAAGDRTGFTLAALKIGILQNNGGIVPTHSLLPDSPAVNAGNNNLIPPDTADADGDGNTLEPAPFDGRGAAFDRVKFGAVDIGAFELQTDGSQNAPYLTVNNLSDTDDGHCTVADCSLREAVNAVNLNTGDNSIRFVNGLTGNIALTEPLANLNKNVNIEGPGAKLLTIRRNLSSINSADTRIFTINASVTVSISNLTMRDGASLTNGGAINNSGSLNLFECVIANSSAQNNGGAIYSTGSVKIERCTINNNNAGNGFSGNGSGGGLYLAGNNATATLINSTFAINTAAQNGGALELQNGANASSDSCTIAGNSAIVSGGGIKISSSAGAVNLQNTLIAGNAAPNDPNVSGTTTGSANLILAALAEAGLETDNNGKPWLKDNGGKTPTVALMQGSPAISVGSTIQPVDQRDVFRKQISGNPNGVNEIDIGAYDSVDSAQTGSAAVVNTLSDTDDTVCGVLNCSLREALGRSSAGLITFAPNVRGTIQLGRALPNVQNRNIQGPGASLLTVRGLADQNIKFSIFNDCLLGCAENGAFTVSGLTISNGSAQYDAGGAIMINGSILNVSDCVFINNRGHWGGAVSIMDQFSNLGNGSVIKNSTFINNIGNLGGAVFLRDVNAVLKNNTFTNNQGSGAVYYMTYFPRTYEVESNTITRNRGGGVYTEDRGCGSCAIKFRNNIIGGNFASDGSTPGVDVNHSNASSPVFVSEGYNLIGAGNVADRFIQIGDQTNVTSANLKLAPLGAYGGQMPTVALLVGSPALDKGKGFGSTSDQRGLPRVSDDANLPNAAGGDGTDIGAFEKDAQEAQLTFESDVAPRPHGNGVMNADDIIQTARFVAGLDTEFLSNEFQRADSAPRSSSGNGILSAADLTQAARYAAGIDSLQIMSGASTGLNLREAGKTRIKSEIATEKVITIENVAEPREIRPVFVSRSGNFLNVGVEINTASAAAQANSIGFTLLFEQNVLSNPIVTLGSGASGAQLIVNPNQTANGRLGLILYKQVNETFATGALPLLSITFAIAQNAPAATTLSFGDSTVFREVSDVGGNAVATDFTPATIALLNPTAASVSVSGRVTNADERPISGVMIEMTDQNGQVRLARTNPFGFYRFTDVPAGQAYIVAVSAKQYTFTPRVIVVNEELDSLNFVAVP